VTEISPDTAPTVLDTAVKRPDAASTIVENREDSTALWAQLAFLPRILVKDPCRETPFVSSCLSRACTTQMIVFHEENRGKRAFLHHLLRSPGMRATQVGR
jgi:hypothetical protein